MPDIQQQTPAKATESTTPAESPKSLTLPSRPEKATAPTADGSAPTLSNQEFYDSIKEI